MDHFKERRITFCFQYFFVHVLRGNRTGQHYNCKPTFFRYESHARTFQSHSCLPCDRVTFHSSENKHLLPADRKPGEETESLVGKQVEYVTDKGVKRTGLVIYQVPAKPSVYYIKYDDDFHIHVYDLVKTT